MKRYIFLLLTALTLVFAACSSDGDTSVNPGKLEIGLAPAWDVTRGMTSASQTSRVTVTLNAPTVHWTVSSDSEWCVVDEEENHVGSGEFVVEVTANDDFKTRNAIVTIAAGAYKYQVEVDQSGNIFILDQIYSVVGSNDTNTFDLKVKTLSQWQAVDSDWIHSEVVSASDPDENGMTESVLRIHCDANTTAAGRYGTLTIDPTEGMGYSTVYTIYQFGTDVQIDDEGKLSLPSRSGDAFEVVAPAEAVVGVVCPEWITYTAVPAEDETTSTYTFAVADNPSDTKTKREGTIEFSIRDIAAKAVLPSVKQDFYPVGGIISGAGFNMFAAAFNAGESISDWTSGDSGKSVQIMGDVDMTDVVWTSVGTETRPFDGIILGNEHKILNWNSAQPLFGYLAEGAEVRDLTIDASSKIVAKGTAAGVYTAAIVGVCNGTLKNCQNQAMVTLDVTAAIDGATGVAGVVGLVGATGRVEGCSNKALITLGDKVAADKLTIGGIAAETAAGALVTGCVNDGAISSNGATPADSKTGLYTGGVVGYALGSVENCTTEGGKAISLRSKSGYMTYTGGIAGRTGGDITGCTNNQPVSIMTNRYSGDVEVCRYAYAGGVAGMANGAITGCKNQGTVSSSAICKFVIMGGIVGSADGVVSGSSNIAPVAAPGNPDGADGPMKEKYIGPRYAYAGGLAGQLTTKGSIVGNGSTTNSGAVSVALMEHNSGSLVYAGGVVGQMLGKVSNTINTGDVSVAAAPASGGAEWNIRSLGGIAGQVGDAGVTTVNNSGASITDSKNLGNLSHEKMTRVDNKPVYMGGIAGFVFESSCTISGCSNSGDVNGNYYNNQVEYGILGAKARANSTGGIVGAAVSAATAATDAEVNVISSCTNTGQIVAFRGVSGGIVGYVEGAKIIDCTNTGEFSTNTSIMRAGRSGGIAAKAVNTLIDGCLNQATVAADDTTTPIMVAGIVGALSDGSAVKNCKHFGTLSCPPYGTKTIAGGGIAGTSVAGTTIDNCGFGGRIKGKSTTTDLTLGEVCSDKNFTSTAANYLWDGK